MFRVDPKLIYALHLPKIISKQGSYIGYKETNLNFVDPSPPPFASSEGGVSPLLSFALIV
jgi:hypothetical protein